MTKILAAQWADLGAIERAVTVVTRGCTAQWPNLGAIERAVRVSGPGEVVGVGALDRPDVMQNLFCT